MTARTKEEQEEADVRVDAIQPIASKHGKDQFEYADLYGSIQAIVIEAEARTWEKAAHLAQDIIANGVVVLSAGEVANVFLKEAKRVMKV